jgi:hypothetical protein
MSNYWIWTFFFLHCLPVPSALLAENPSRLEGSMEAYICKSIGGCLQRYRQGLCGKTSQGCCGEGKELECRVTPEQHLSLHPVNSNSTNSYASIHLPGQGQPGQHQQQHIQRCPCNREASASLPRVPLISLGKQFCAVLEFNSETTVQIGALFCLVFFHFPPGIEFEDA